MKSTKAFSLGSRSPRQDLLRYLRGMSHLTGVGQARVESVVLAQGTWFESPQKPRPAGVYKMSNKQCFRNALLLAGEKAGWQYVEGIAVAIIPTVHAWCVDETGIVVESTWKEPAGAYIGIPMEQTAVWKFLVKTKVYGVLDSLAQRGWPEAECKALGIQPPPCRKVAAKRGVQ